MSLIIQVADKIASVHGRDDPYNYALALDIVALLEQHHADDRNRLSEMLDRRTTELQRLQRLVGEEA